MIAPYMAQVKELQRRLNSVKNTLEGIRVEIKSIDAVQGSEADLVILSTVRSNSDGRIGFLSADERVNVALSRAQRGLIIVGDHKFLSSSDSPFTKVLKYIRENPDFSQIEEIER